MIRPKNFCANSQTAESNHFQKLESHCDLGANARACLEFDGLVRALTKAAVNVLEIDDTDQPATPDAIFPNNWVSTHADGSVVLYPMLAANRRPERRPEILQSLALKNGFKISNLIDLTRWETSQHYLEGTGSLVLDRVTRTAYASISPRTHPVVLEEFAERMQYKLVTFNSCDQAQQTIYHTNVMLSIGTSLALICATAIDPNHRQTVLGSLRSTGRHLIEITFKQMAQFAGNALELTIKPNAHTMAMSTQAFSSLTHAQVDSIERYCGAITHAPIPTIEKLGGGSVRCMLAEVHLPRDGKT